MSLKNKPRTAEFVRFAINGAVATAVHFAVLAFNVQVWGLKPVGLANFLAALIGITVSFLGNRYFVFKRTDQGILRQASQFVVLYGLLALMHGGVLSLWSDLFHLDYRWGFVLATGFQLVLSFLGNKKVVFKK